jgi:C4-dicarboxylate transporter DctM subunit
MSGEWLVPMVLVLLFTLIFLGAHLGLAMTGVAVFGTMFMIGREPALSLAGLSIYETALSLELSVIPLFVLMGTIASNSGISADLYDAFNVWLRKHRGGLAHATIAACGAFGAVCGSSLATAATMGQVALPQMDKHGYDPRLPTGAVAAGGTIGILIPPSVIMVIYGILTETSIGDLFIAGIVPGLMLVAAFLITVMIMVQRQPGIAPRLDQTPLDQTLVKSPLSKVWPTLCLFVIVIGGIYGGIFTPTEAAGIGATGALAIGLLMRRLTLAQIKQSFMETLETTAMIFLILIGAILFSSFLTLAIHHR